MEEEKKQKNELWLKYINIPIEVFGNKKLNYTDAIIFCLIELLDGNKGCFAGNNYFAKVLDISKTSVSTSISKLIEFKYVNDVAFDGRKRTIKINPKYKEIYKDIYKDINLKMKSSLKENLKSDIKKNEPKNPLRKLKNRVKENLKSDIKKTLNINNNILNNNIVSNKISLLHKEKDFSNPSYKTSSSNKSLPKRKPLQRSKPKESTLSERDKIKLKIQQQKEADLLKQENKTLQTKNNSKNSKEIIYNKNINSNQLIEFWNNLGIIKHQKGKVIEKSIIAIDKYSKDYTEDQIKQSMKQYSIMLSGNGYSRIQDRAPYKVSLPEFFEFDDFTLKRINKSNGDRTILNGVKSWFIECLNDENYLKDKYSVIAKDKYPKITKEIKKVWNKFLYEWDGRYEEMKEEGKYTALEENIYRKISRRLVEFFEVNKNELKADDALELTQWFESCVTEIENSEYQLGFLAGDVFWGSQFINYLKDCGDMSERTYTQKEMMALSDKERKQMNDNQDEETNYSYLYEGMQSDMTINDLAY